MTCTCEMQGRNVGWMNHSVGCPARRPPTVEEIRAAAHSATPADADILTPQMRQVLDILGNGGHIVWWGPVEGDPGTVLVVWPDESTTQIECSEMSLPDAYEQTGD